MQKGLTPNDSVLPSDDSILSNIQNSLQALEQIKSAMQKKYRNIENGLVKIEASIEQESPQEIEEEMKAIEQEIDAQLDSAVIEFATKEEDEDREDSDVGEE